MRVLYEPIRNTQHFVRKKWRNAKHVLKVLSVSLLPKDCKCILCAQAPTASYIQDRQKLMFKGGAGNGFL